MARKGRVDRGLVQKRNTAGQKVWYVRLYHNGKEEWFGSFPSKTEARDFYDNSKSQQRSKKFFPEQYQLRTSDTLASIIKRYTDKLDGCGKKKKTIQDERWYGKWWTHRLEGIRLNTLTADLVDEVKRELTLKGLAPQTVLHTLKFLRHVLYAEIGKSKLIDNPFEKTKLPKVRPSKTRYLSPAEEKMLCEQIGPTYAPWVRLAILTGLRRGEQLGLRWEDVDLEKGLLALPDTKSGGLQYAFLNDEARGILRRIQNSQLEKGRCGLWVFPSPGNPTKHLDADNFYGRIFLPAVRDAKLEGVTWHTLRHTFASRLAMGGQNASTIAELLRHSGLGLVKRYAHLSPGHMRQAVEAVACFGQESPPEGKTQEETQAGTVIKPETQEAEPLKIGRGERI